MTFSHFLFIAGACFVFAAALAYLGQWSAAQAAFVPAIVFLICGAGLMIRHFWTFRRKR